LAQFGLPEVVPVREVPQELDLAADADLAAHNRALMNPEQREAVDHILAAVDEVQGGVPETARTYFVDGPGGSGKTFIYNTLISTLRSRSLKVTYLPLYIYPVPIFYQA
jgi:primosomal protein N'